MRNVLIFVGMILLSIVLSACGDNKSTEENKDAEQNGQVVSDEDTNAETTDKENEEKDENTTENQTSVIANHDFYEPFSGKVDHIHGLGYIGNQNAIFFATHDGLKAYENGQWFKTKELNNDYMGFSPVDTGFYTSGHPGEGVNLPNPLGLKRSVDYGQTLEDLGLEGESDFHAMGVGYENHTIYVLNAHENSIMDPGFYVSRDDGATWEEIQAKGLGEKVFSIAVHPTNDQMLAIAGQEGIFLSTDGGQSFRALTTNMQGTAVFFSEETLWYGGYDSGPVLVKYMIDGEQVEELFLPKMNQDAVMYIAQNPKNASELVFASFNGDIYLSEDGAETWNTLVKEGKIQQ